MALFDLFKSKDTLQKIRQQASPGMNLEELTKFAATLGFSVSLTPDGKIVPIPMSLASFETHSIGQETQLGDNLFTSNENRDYRLKVYDKMDLSGDLGAIALDTYSSEVLNVSHTVNESVIIEISDKKMEEKIKEVLQTNGIMKNMEQDIRSMCKYGDFSYLLFPSSEVSELVRVNVDLAKRGSYLEPSEALRPQDIVVRPAKSPDYKLEALGNRITALNTASDTLQTIYYARDKRTENFLRKEYYPWEFALFSLESRDTFPYGRSMLERFRVPYEALSTLENLLSITRANKLDKIAVKVPGFESHADPTSMMARLSQIKNSIKSMLLTPGSLYGWNNSRMTRNQDQALTEWIFAPDTFKIEKLPTALDFGSTEDVEYFRDKVINATGIPKARFLADKTDTRIGTLQQLDKAFARLLLPIGAAYCEGLKRLIVLIAFYLGADISKLEIRVAMKSPPFMTEELLDIYDGLLNIVDKYVGLKRTITGKDDYRVSDDEIKKMLDMIGCDSVLIYPTQENLMNTKAPISLYESKSSKGQFMTLYDV
jgi:hypothetical protein